MRFTSLLLLIAVTISSCNNPQPGPDKTIAGALLGAGWGAGAGAIIGNNVGGEFNEGNRPGEGAAIGAGFGLVSGALTGAGYDLVETTQINNEKELASLRIQNASNGQQIAQIQAKVDRAVSGAASLGIVYQVFFDVDATSLRTGATANLEVVAESIKSSPSAGRVKVVGHSDDAGTPAYNQKLAEARASAVSGYLASRGVASDQIISESHGATRPIATNTTPVGRQLNRRVDVYISH